MEFEALCDRTTDECAQRAPKVSSAPLGNGGSGNGEYAVKTLQQQVVLVALTNPYVYRSFLMIKPHIFTSLRFTFFLFVILWHLPHVCRKFWSLIVKSIFATFAERFGS